MVEFTFLELHVQDASLTTGGDDAADGDVAFEAADEARPPERGDSSKGAVVAAFVGLVFLAVVAYLVKTRVRSEDDEEFEFDNDD